MSNEKRNLYKIKIYEVFRQRIFAEDFEINSRTYLTIIIQIGFILCWLLADQIKGDYAVRDFRQFLSACQLIAASFSLMSILTALREIRNNKKRYKDRYADILDDRYVPLVIGGSRFHQAGHALSILTQLIFIGVGGFFLYLSRY